MENELDICESLFKVVNKLDGINLINDSNLSQREKIFFTHYLIRERTIKEIAEFSLLAESLLLKEMEEAGRKFYNWIYSKGYIDYVLKITNKSIYHTIMADKVIRDI